MLISDAVSEARHDIVDFVKAEFAAYQTRISDAVSEARHDLVDFVKAEFAAYRMRISDAVSEAGHDLADFAKVEYAEYREKILRSVSAYFPSNRHYFDVNDDYVKNKLKMVLFPFLHKGPWVRTTEMVGKEVSYKPPVYDTNAPDMYIPMMAFLTYLVLVVFFLGINGMFSAGALGLQISTALLCWLLQVLLLEATLLSLGRDDVPVLDIVAYGGYIFIAACVIVLGRMIWNCAFWVLILWESFCMGVFLVKTTKRILIAGVKLVKMDSTKRNYHLPFMAVSQIPLLLWLGSICAETQ